MMNKNIEVAQLCDYGYKERKFSKCLWKILKYGFIVISCLLLYLPIFIIFLQSINSTTDNFQFTGLTLKWYLEIVHHDSLMNSIKNTFIISISTSLIVTVLGTFVAIGIHVLEQKTRRRIILLNNVPLLNSDIVTGISLMLMFSLLLPLFPYIFGFPTLLLAHLFFTFPYVILSVLPKIREVNPSLMDAALDLGLTPFKALVKALIPSLKSGILSGMLLAFTMSFDDFVVSYFTTGNGFDNFSIWIYGAIGRKSLSPTVYAFSSIMTIVTIGFVVILNLKKDKKQNG